MGKKTTRKMRGKKTFGYGSKKKHRGAGSRGGRGLAGSFKHKKLKILKENPDHYGKHGFRRRNRKTVNSINLRDLDNLSQKLGKKKLNLKELGYNKVLGKGQVTQKLEIEADSFSKKAKEKIEEAGGKAIELDKEVKEAPETKKEGKK